MAMCNIPSTNTDPSYRYKMPRIITKAEGRGIGLKTRIVNMSEVAHKLYRPPQYLTKWFGIELGARAAGSSDGDSSAIINGAHDSHVLQSSLDKFIEKYVLCPDCMLPEIDLRIRKETLSAKCKACGWSGQLDNSHKIAAFLVKNPIDCHGNVVAQLTSNAQGDSQDKNARRAAKTAAQQARSDDEGKGKQKKDKKDKKDRKREEHGSDHDKGEANGKADTKESKAKRDKNAQANGGSKDGKHSKAISDVAQDGDVFEFDDAEMTSMIMGLIEFVESKGGHPTRDDFFREVRVMQLANGFDHKIRLYVVLRVIFRSAMDAKRLADQSKLLDKFITKCSLETKDVLWAFNVYFEASKNDLDASRCLPLVLKVLYDEEWCTEEGILSYYNNDEGTGELGFELAKASAKPFLTWLEQNVAESDSEADGSEEQERG